VFCLFRNLQYWAGMIFHRWLSPLFHFQSTIVVPSWTPPDFLSPWKASTFRWVLLTILTALKPSPKSLLWVHRIDWSRTSGLYGISCTCRNIISGQVWHCWRHNIFCSRGKKKRNRLSWGLPLSYQSAELFICQLMPTKSRDTTYFTTGYILHHVHPKRIFWRKSIIYFINNLTRVSK